jgi:hypothetical protein
MARAPTLPKLPKLLAGKIYKTGQTRGADDDQIYQNRVGRNSTVLIPLSVWRSQPVVRQVEYENGYIILVPPPVFFGHDGNRQLQTDGVVVGTNGLVFYELRTHWDTWRPQEHGLRLPTSRSAPLGGQYIARVANTTSADDARINEGYTSTGLKGAGIRLYEYAPLSVIQNTRIQLEAIFWMAGDSIQTCVEAGMTKAHAELRKQVKTAEALAKGLLDLDELRSVRAIDGNNKLVCPLCLAELKSLGFLSRMAQAEGRERHDQTVTEVNLFHIKELAFGLLNHRSYNLGWGHHHCNVVCKDSGILETLAWMQDVLDRNRGLLGK